jgi:hypothetical protein
MYINNVDKRLRELEQPSENDYKRWIWELIQNAKDSIVEDNVKKFVDIKLIVKNEIVVFKHNGSPFTAKALFGLLYKYSAGDINNTESTGRFGTGFLTTHTLSKIVTIEGDLYKDNVKNELCGFSATMYRDGIDADELLDGIRRTRASLSYTEEKNNWTTYTYHLTTEQNKTALQLGLENFIANIAQTMLFCKELNTVELDDNGTITKIIRKQSQQLENEIGISEFEITGNNPHTRKFLHKKLSKHSDDLTKRFKTDRLVRLMAAIEIDNDNNLVENEIVPSHFCVLPLVGSEKHIIPIYLNSPDFEPDSERQSLLLDGSVDWEEHKELGTIITVRGINRIILKESIELYDSLVSYVCNNNYNKLYLLTKGLKRTPDFEKNFNKDWFEKEIILPYRDVLKQYAIVETENGNQKLFNDDNTPNIIIPRGNKDVRQEIYSLAIELFPAKLPLEKYASNWASFAWNDCGLFEKEDLCKFVSERENASNLPSYEWINKFLTFIKGEDEALLKKYALIPNVNGDLTLLDDETISEGLDLTDYMLDVLNFLGNDLKPVLLNKKITTISLPIKIDKKSIAEKINDQADIIIKDKNLSVKETIEKLLPLLNTIPISETAYKAEFIQKQKQIHNSTKTLYSDLQIIEYANNDIPENAFQTLHKWLIKQLMVVVSNYKNIDSLPENIVDKIEWINSFIAFVSKEIKEGELDEYAIIPNQKGNFCFKMDLSKDINIPDEFKSDSAESFGIKLKDNLLNKDIKSINISSEKNINSVIEIINENFTLNKFEAGNDDLDFAIYLLHFLPEQTSPTLHKSQKLFLSIVRKYYYDRSKSYSENIISCNSEDFWRKCNDKIVSRLISQLEEDKNIKILQKHLSNSGSPFDNGDTIIFLNDFYDYLKLTNRNITGKILPNQNGNFCSLEDDFYKDDRIPDELKDVLYLVNSKDDFRNILAETSLSLQPTHPKNIEDIAKYIDDAIKDTFADSRNWDDESFKKAVVILTKYFRNHRDSGEIFKYSWNKKDTIELNVLVGEDGIKILQSLHNGELDIEQIKQKDNEIAQLKEENSKLKTKNEELEKLLAEKEEIENEKIALEDQLREIVKTDPDSFEIEIIQEQIRIKDDEITAIGDTTIAIDYDNDISVSDQKEANREAKEIVKERLEKDGFSFTRGIDGYSTVDGVIKGNTEYPLVVKSYKYQGAPLKIGANEWLQLMKPNSMFWVHFGNRKLGCLNLYDLLRKQDKLSLSFNTENLDFENRLDNFAELLHYFKNVHFDFNSIRPDNYSTAENLSNYRFNERRKETDLSSDDDSLL